MNGKVLVFLFACCAGTLMAHADTVGTHLTEDDSVRSIVGHPAFKGFGHLLLPREDDARSLDTPLSNVRSLMPYHGHVNTAIVVGALNHMIDEVRSGKPIFYDFYTEKEKRSEPGKENTGLFFFRGERGAPFAVVCPGGGFSYVGSLHEGFPLALEISKRKYNAFVLRYRIGSEKNATEDLAAAIAYIRRNAATLGVNPDGHSLWGGSAGARMVGNIASGGIEANNGGELPKPSAVVMAYTGQSGVSRNFPPSFIVTSEDDGIANVSTVDQRVENLRKAGVVVEYRRYRNAGHGFGIGTGTEAAGWVNYAIRFWEKQLGGRNST